MKRLSELIQIMVNPTITREWLTAARVITSWPLRNFNQAAPLMANKAMVWYDRAISHSNIGDQVTAQSDFAKARELGFPPSTS